MADASPEDNGTGCLKIAESSKVGEKKELASAEGVPDVPDPDEDDLDDLDDMLDEFSTVKVNEGPSEPEPEPAPPHATAAREADKVPSMDELLSDDEFAKQLQAGMADLLGEIENSADMKAQFEGIFKELDKAACAEAEPGKSPNAETPQSTPAAGVSNTDASFQETIRRTMERMQTSGDQATAAATAGGSDDFMAELLKQMQSDGVEGAGSDEELSKMLLGMMEQLTNKEILYEPMKELNAKFPGWLETNKSKVSQDDLKRYQEQQRLVREMVTKFEDPSYSDENASDREYVVDRMQQMQAAGSPPSDLVGDMPSAQDALNAPDEACNPQ